MGPRIALALTFCGVLAACARAPADPVAPPPPASEEAAFSPQRAWEHLRHLTEIGPRASGTGGAAKARKYIRGELEALDLDVVSLATRMTLDDGSVLELESLVATVPGASPDLFVLMAPYDTRYFESFEFVGANDGGSGPALLLEVTRVLTLRPLPYTTWIVFLDAEAPLGRGSAEEATTAWIGSSELAQLWSEDGKLGSIRLLLYANQVADADLRIARDLRSHRGYRETFWEVGQRLGRGDVFAPAQRYDSPVAGHVPFVSRGLRRALLIMDSSFGGDEPPGIYADTEDDTLARCSAESLGAVGEVTVAALDEIATRLAKIDRFADAPLREPAGSPVPLLPGPAAESPAPSTDAPATGAQDAAGPEGDATAAEEP